VWSCRSEGFGFCGAGFWLIKRGVEVDIARRLLWLLSWVCDFGLKGEMKLALKESVSTVE
jgi:hypothetical protein